MKLIKIEETIKPLFRAGVSEVGLEIDKDIEYQDWEDIGKTLKVFNRANLWWLADWLNFGERKYGEMYAQALEGTDYEYQTLKHIKSTADKVEKCRRKHNLSFSHHIEVKSLEPKDQEKFLNKAEENNWTIREMRNAIRSKEECQHLETEKVERCLKCKKIL